MSQAKERPILFSGSMVSAILDGRKTVTRRPIKPSMRGFDVSFELHQQEDGSWRPMHTFDESCMDDQGTEHPVICPYGKPGDRLWVRETWYCDHFEVMRGPYLKPADLDVTEARSDGTLVYAADGLTPFEADQPAWKPSIHMPRWASRILLEVTDVGVEQLQAISIGQICKEGLARSIYEFIPVTTAFDAFAEVWDSINGPGAWEANPWVWAVEFKQVQS
ncbi:MULTISPECIES: hypothetical protein [Pseudomonas]|jgi:hypothetical protein|uniref:Morphogenetic protein n=1 Tax=Pseudomonas putida TaxID=303 RepID=A0A1L7NFV9_PSEPU|nr:MULTISPECIES: hypothetical protein [Pseudomonas]MBP2082420.1 hypothetical protein [Pseudomonas sp. PvP089]MBP2091961.1 hypothetical protein [Pseudomonas sp. PvP088]MBP2221876.1 hypothetical protein [Pseudomonas putida]PMY81531.1 hypothetical protein C1X72_09400 [Pseudomonas sp. FW306-2-2C-D06B]BAW24347.1 Uncharacterized protein KF715C_ch37740 [Pseudomonas putida]